MRFPKIQTTMLRVIALMAGFFLTTSSKATVPVSDLPGFDGLGTFSELGNNITVHNATVNGNEGVSENGLFELDNPGTVNGNLYQATGATIDIAGNLNGSLFTGQNLTTEQSTVFSASSAMAALAPDQIIGTDQTESLSFNVPAGQVFVVNLNGGLNLQNKNITLTGGGDLLLNISNSFTLSGSSSILGTPQNIFVNYLGTSDVTTKENDVIDAEAFFPNASVNDKSLWTGAIYSGNENVELMANAVLNGEPVPEPGAMMLAGLGGLSIILLRGRKFSLRGKNLKNE